MSYFVGVDGGGTKTAAVVLSAGAAAVVGRGLAGPGNSRSIGVAAASQEIARAINAALVDARVTLDQINALCLCLAGFDTNLDLPVPQGAVSLLGYVGPTVFENDVVGAWAGATDVNPGVVAIAGTGSTALGMNARGAFCRVGGWDYLLGDDGSAYAIGLEGIRAAIRALDGEDDARAPTRLALEVRAAYGVEDAAALRRRWDSGQLGKREIAAFAAHVGHSALDWADVIARQILNRAAERLAESVHTTCRRLAMGDEAVPVYTIGGVFTSPVVMDTFRLRLTARMPNVTFGEPKQPPAIGAALLARQRLDDGDLGSWTLGTGRRPIQRSLRVADLFPDAEAIR